MGEKPITRSGPYFLHGIQIGSGNHFVRLFHCTRAKPPYRVCFLRFGALRLQQYSPTHPQGSAFARPRAKAQQTPRKGVFQTVGAVQIPRVTRAAQPLAGSSWFTGGRGVCAGNRSAAFPTSPNRFDIDFPTARAGAIHTVRRAHDLVCQRAR